MRTAVAAVLVASSLLALPRVAHAQPRPGLHVDLTLEPSAPGIVAAFPGSANGLQVVLPEHAHNEVLFGAGLGLGALLTKHLEAGAMGSLSVASNGDDTVVFGVCPFLKFNLWATKHVNPFFQPFAGFLLLSSGHNDTYFDGGMYFGLDLLVTTWGIRLYTGFEAIVGEGTYTFGVPLKWALVAYF
jgi:hypothetical protein